MRICEICKRERGVDKPCYEHLNGAQDQDDAPAVEEWRWIGPVNMFHSSYVAFCATHRVNMESWLLPFWQAVPITPPTGSR